MHPMAEQRYCLACHKLLVSSFRVCDKCGANQEEARAAWVAKMNAPAPKRRPGQKREAPIPLNAIEAVRCPSCHVMIPAGAPSCSYCLHDMLDDGELPVLDTSHAHRNARIAFVLAALAVFGATVRVGLPSILVAMIGLGFAILAHGEDPLAWSGTFAIAATTSSFFVTLMIVAMKTKYG